MITTDTAMMAKLVQPRMLDNGLLILLPRMFLSLELYDGKEDWDCHHPVYHGSIDKGLYRVYV